MKEAFADTGYWVSLLNPHDAMHFHARGIAKTLSIQRIVTSEWVLVELLNYFSERGPLFRDITSNAVAAMFRDPKVFVITPPGDLFSEALHLYQNRPDKAWSLTDCSSFLIMEKRGISAALTSDHHFEQAGFRALMRS